MFLVMCVAIFVMTMNNDDDDDDEASHWQTNIINKIQFIARSIKSKFNYFYNHIKHTHTHIDIDDDNERWTQSILITKTKQPNRPLHTNTRTHHL